MALSLKHSFQSPVADKPSTSVVKPSDWNAEHALQMSSGFVVGRLEAGVGAAQEVPFLPVLPISDRDLSAPPGSPVNGSCYIVKATGTGAWASQDDKIAVRQDGAWKFYAPAEGWLAWIMDEDGVVAFDGSSWAAVGGGGGGDGSFSTMGVNATADATNKLSVSSPASLFNHDGNGHQVKVNKNATGDTATFLFQTNWSGRAEIGLAGDDDFSFKVSANGSDWFTGMTFVPAAKGVPRIPSFTVALLPSAGTAGAGALAYVSNETGGGVLAFSDGTNWRRVTDRVVVCRAGSDPLVIVLWDDAQVMTWDDSVAIIWDS